MSGMNSYKIGDKVEILTDVDYFDISGFPIGTIGEVVEVKDAFRDRPRLYRVLSGNGDWWVYSAEQLKLCEEVENDT